MDFQFADAEGVRARFESIEARRSSLGVSVAQLCRRADMSEATYYRLLKGKKRQPHFRTVNRLQTALRDFEERIA
jgi:predicted transcriptional regulator